MYLAQKTSISQLSWVMPALDQLKKKRKNATEHKKTEKCQIDRRAFVFEHFSHKTTTI